MARFSMPDRLSPRLDRVVSACALGAWLAIAASAPVFAADKPERGEAYHRDYIFGVPNDPTEEWALASGGRIYDKWWEALGTEEPKGQTHPAYPAAGKQKGSGTFRCKECHGWDYRGAAGAYATGSRFTGIKGVDGMAGADPVKIALLLRDKLHGFTRAMIPDDALDRLASFVSKGQFDADSAIDRATKKAKGDVQRGRVLYQAICAACHGFDGKSINFGNEKQPEYVGTIAAANPWEMLHKVRNGQPGTPMPVMRGLDVQAVVDILAYGQTLPTK